MTNKINHIGRIIMYIGYIVGTFILYLIHGRIGMLSGIMVILGHTGLYIVELLER